MSESSPSESSPSESSPSENSPSERSPSAASTPHAAAGERVSPGTSPAPAPEGARHPLLSRLGAAVRARRQALGWTRQALAHQAGLSLRFLAEVESGQANVSVIKLADLAQALNVSLTSLLSGESGGGAAASPPRVIALVGLRGAGKSTLGRLLGQRLGAPFVELDALIQEATGLALAELFELHGESYYRRAEREALERIVNGGKSCVVAVSGGIVTDPQALGLLRERTLMVWIKTRPEQHMQRVEAQGDRRPMANRPNAMAQLQGLLRARTPYYRQARLVLDTSAEPADVCAERLAEEIRRLTTPAGAGT